MSSDIEVDQTFDDCVSRIPTKNLPNQLLFEDGIVSQIQFASEAGVKNFPVFLVPSNGQNSLPKKPFHLKNQLIELVPHHGGIRQVLHTRQGKLLIHTDSEKTATEVCSISVLHEVPVAPEIQLDYITSKFLLKDIPVDLPLDILSSELSQIAKTACASLDLSGFSFTISRLAQK